MTNTMLSRPSWRSAWCYLSEQLSSLLIWDLNSLKMFGMSARDYRCPQTHKPECKATVAFFTQEQGSI